MEIKNIEDSNFEKIIGTQLHKFNRENCEWILKNTEEKPTKTNYCNFGVYDNDKLIGGAVGYIAWKWYFLDQLWIDKQYRKSGIGTKIINKIEQCAKDKELLGVRMETWSFQARGFYEKKGYEVYATFEDCPPGTIDYFLRKRF